MKMSEAMDRVWQLAQERLLNCSGAEEGYEKDQEAVNLVHDFLVNYLLDNLREDEENDN